MYRPRQHFDQMNSLRFIPFLLLLSFSCINAQNDMLIGQLANKVVVRENFNHKGDFLNKQIFRGGKVIKTKSYYELEVVTELLDESGKLKDRYTATYRCNPGESRIMVLAFPFSNSKSKETKINTTSENFKELYDLDSLEDIELEMKFDSGLLNLFGSKSIIKIYDRVLQITGNQKQIKSKIEVKAYAWGIRIKKLDYSVDEKLNTDGFLAYQKFTEEDGSYFTITYKKLEI